MPDCPNRVFIANSLAFFSAAQFRFFSVWYSRCTSSLGSQRTWLSSWHSAQMTKLETVLALSPGLFDDQHALVDPVGHPEQGEPFGWLHGKGHHFHLD